jgi:hypothetical protein
MLKGEGECQDNPCMSILTLSTRKVPLLNKGSPSFFPYLNFYVEWEGGRTILPWGETSVGGGRLLCGVTLLYGLAHGICFFLF